jgi:hypothetical protein
MNVRECRRSTISKGSGSGHGVTADHALLRRDDSNMAEIVTSATVQFRIVWE